MAINLRTPTSYNGQKATENKFGALRFATDAEAAAQIDGVALQPSQASSSVPDATTSVKGKAQLATAAETVTGTNDTKIVTPADVTARLAAPGAIGGTTPAAGTFTGVTATTSGFTATLGDIVASAGDITATLGDITATAGDIIVAAAGGRVKVATGANATAGVSDAMSGTPGAVTVATTACSATALIFYSRATAGGTLGSVAITAQDATGFTLTSDANETSTFNWWIIND